MLRLLDQKRVWSAEDERALEYRYSCEFTRDVVCSPRTGTQVLTCRPSRSVMNFKGKNTKGVQIMSKS